jgi:tryptophan synthase beta subunit
MNQVNMSEQIKSEVKEMPDQFGRFGDFGGRYVPETLMNALIELEQSYEQVKEEPDFQAELAYLLKQYAGRENPLYYAERLTNHLGGANWRRATWCGNSNSGGITWYGM